MSLSLWAAWTFFFLEIRCFVLRRSSLNCWSHFEIPFYCFSFDEQQELRVNPRVIVNITSSTFGDVLINGWEEQVTPEWKGRVDIIRNKAYIPRSYQEQFFKALPVGFLEIINRAIDYIGFIWIFRFKSNLISLWSVLRISSNPCTLYIFSRMFVRIKSRVFPILVGKSTICHMKLSSLF